MARANEALRPLWILQITAKLRKFDDYEETKQLLNDTQTALAEANSQLAKEKEEHEKTKGKLQAQDMSF